MSKALLTPRDLADAVGVSESSMRRWIDSGRLKMTRTAGGHRRIALAEAVRFIRETGTPLVRGEILGLGEIPSLSQVISNEEQQLFEALYAGDRSLGRGLVTAWHMAGRSLADIFDGPMRSALIRFGELWLKNPCGILIEHRATEMCSEIVHILHSYLPAVQSESLVALGAAMESEEHGLLSQMASTVAREGGFQDFNYGANAPIALLEQAAEYHKADVVWLTITMKPPRGGLAKVRKLAGKLAARGMPLVVGGQAAEMVGSHRNLTILKSMSEFEAYLCNLRKNAHSRAS